MSENRHVPETVEPKMIDVYTIMVDLCKNWWVILSLAISVALLLYVAADIKSSSSYSIETTYAVTYKGVNNSVYDSLTKSLDTTSELSKVLNSSTLSSKVAEDMGVRKVPGSISSSLITDTNLLTLKVTAETPQLAYQIMQSAMRCYPLIAAYLIGNSDVNLLMEPQIPMQPDQGRSPASVLILGFLLSLMVMVMLFASLSFMKDTIRSRSEIEKKLDTYLLGTIYHEKKKKSQKALLITDRNCNMRYEENIQKTCCKIRNRMDATGAKTLLVTSCMENEGKSTVAANIALGLLKSGKRVVLVDLDFRNPAQYKIMNSAKKNGISLEGVLNGSNPFSDDQIIRMESGLCVVLNEQKLPNSAELLTAGRLEEMLVYLKERFDYVVLDTPPMAYVADTEEIAYMADASLMVIKEHTAQVKMIREMLEVLEHSEGNVIGCVFNNVHKQVRTKLLEKSNYGYGYYYERN